MVEGISHITFIVKDLEKMKRLIVEVLGGEEDMTKAMQAMAG